VNTRYDGSAVFQQSGADVFQALIGLRDDLQNTALSDTALSQSLNQRIAQITTARNAVQDVTGEQSADLATLQTLSNSVSNSQLADQTRLGDLQGTDYAAAVVQMQQNQTALQAIYATTAQLLQPGFLNFLQSAQANG
jgi:flagellin-like hook-associated protein FlgL